MAEIIPDKIDILSSRLQKNFLQCSICLEEYKNPKVLNCLHTFCMKCLERYVAGASDIKCPTCNQLMPTPKNGIVELKTNFFIKGIIEEISIIKEPPTNAVGRMMVACSSCESETSIEVKCSDCGGVICRECELHHEKLKVLKSHNVQPAESVELIMHKIDEKFVSMEENYDNLKAQVEDLTEKIEEIEKDRDENINQIKKSKEALLNIVENYVVNLQDMIFENAEQRMAELVHMLKACKAKVQSYEAAKEQQKIISDLEEGDKIDLCKQFLYQLDDVETQVFNCPKIPIPDVERKSFLTSTDNSIQELVACTRLIGFLIPITPRDQRKVNVMVNKGMVEPMQNLAIDCAHDALDQYGNQARNLSTFNAMVKSIDEKFGKKFSRTKWKYIVQEGYGGAGWYVQCHKCIQFTIEDFYFTIYGS